MYELFEVAVRELAQKQLEHDPDFQRQKAQAAALLSSSPDPEALRLVDAYGALYLHRQEVALPLAFCLGFELGQAYVRSREP